MYCCFGFWTEKPSTFEVQEDVTYVTNSPCRGGRPTSERRGRRHSRPDKREGFLSASIEVLRRYQETRGDSGPEADRRQIEFLTFAMRMHAVKQQLELHRPSDVAWYFAFLSVATEYEQESGRYAAALGAELESDRRTELVIRLEAELEASHREEMEKRLGVKLKSERDLFMEAYYSQVLKEPPTIPTSQQNTPREYDD